MSWPSASRTRLPAWSNKTHAAGSPRETALFNLNMCLFIRARFADQICISSSRCFDVIQIGRLTARCSVLPQFCRLFSSDKDGRLKYKERNSSTALHLLKVVIIDTFLITQHEAKQQCERGQLSWWIRRLLESADCRSEQRSWKRINLCFIVQRLVAKCHFLFRKVTKKQKKQSENWTFIHFWWPETQLTDKMMRMVQICPCCPQSLTFQKHIFPLRCGQCGCLLKQMPSLLAYLFRA